ncbi:hypothetical protein CERSUDRAFT_97999 [Gelatoporia subvermispora B]|uniref:Uncharacterized protein n=1 Tax=Ceriporiopsis subvermispora (strain B) TaxID=914234 RepID=M2PE00_CERS8|nr:hypothetical protein CERSUDRAFT_97999 [Gelatoporia subvermispora B]
MNREQALDKLGLLANVLCGGDRLWGSLGAFVLPGRGFTPYKPKTIQAVYLPAWFIDAEVQANVWESDRSDDSETVTAFTSNSFMPGFSIEPLSRLSLNCDALIKHETVPWFDQLRVQNGEEIVCQPFTLSPLALQDAARSLSLKQAQISEGFRLDPSSVNFHMLAAYPVLIPVWLAQYEQHWIAGQTSTITIGIEAWSRWGPRVFSELPDEPFASAVSKFWPSGLVKSDRGPDLLVYGPYREHIQEFADMNVVCRIPDNKNRSAMLNEWINNYVSHQAAMSSFESRYFSKADDATIDWDDLRIRELSEEETSRNKEYLNLSVHTLMMQNLVDALQSDGKRPKVITVSINFSKKNKSDDKKSGSPLPNASGSELQDEQAITFIKSQLEKAVQQRDKKRPRWLTEWTEKRVTASGNNDKEQQ